MKAIIKKETLDFLKSLKRNNKRDWFNANKHRYTEAYENFREFVAIQEIKDNKMMSKDFVNYCSSVMKSIQQLNIFSNNAVK